MCTPLSPPTGFLPLLMYCSFFAALPLVHDYATYDLTEDVDRIVAILISLAGCVILMLATTVHPAVWYNIALFYHAAVEVRACDTILGFAKDETTADQDEVMSLAAVIVIILHLVPFLFMDGTCLLAIVATAGVLVNASALVFIDSGFMFQAAISSTMLLAMILIFRAQTSLSLFSQACIAYEERRLC